MRWFFDGIIFAFLAVGAVFFGLLIHQCFDLRREKRNPRRQKILIAASAAVAIIWLVVGYGSFVEPRLLTVRYEEKQLNSGGSTAFRVALVSDLHAGPYLPGGMVDRIADRILAQNPRPDAVLLAGDFVSEKNIQLEKISGLRRLAEAVPVYGVMGNHDYIDDGIALENRLELLGIRMLRNESAILQKKSTAVALVGVDDVWFGSVDLDAAEYDLPEGMPKILIAHNPDIVYGLADHRYDLILAAHTHGGQIRLPFVGPVPPIPTALGRTYDRGWFSWNDMPFFITQGIGETGPRARLFAPPEIVIMDVRI